MQNELVYKNPDEQVAKTIISQIKSIDFWFLASIGYNSPSFYKNSLSFKVNGSKVGHAWVKITLNSMDTYDIEVFKIRKFKAIDLGKSEGVYSDMLVDVLKNLVERD
jgi:hypothetical protein